jgi:hypothetical protein
MTSETPNLRELAARVETLERQNRRLRCLAVVGLALIGGLVLIAAPKPSQAQPGAPQPQVSSSAFAHVAYCVLLKDDKDNNRGGLGAGGLLLKNEAGRERARYDQEGIVLRDEKGKVRAVLAITKEGAKLELLDENGKVLSHLGR